MPDDRSVAAGRRTRAAASLPYFDPAFPDRSLILHAARPRDWHPGLPVVFVHHGVARNGRDYRDYWLPHVDAGAMLAIAIEFPEASFPEYLWYNFGNLHAKDGTPNPREQWTFGIDTRLFAALRAQGITTTPPLRPVRPLRRRPVRPPHAVVRLSRARRRGGQRQRRHLCDARPERSTGPGALAPPSVTPRRPARAAGVSR